MHHSHFNFDTKWLQKLGLYMNCWMYVENPDKIESNFQQLSSISLLGNQIIGSRSFLSYTDSHSPNEIVPILRPAYDITDSELDELRTFNIKNEEGEITLEYYKQWVCAEQNISFQYSDMLDVIIYLTGKYLDIFDWIGKEWAYDINGFNEDLNYNDSYPMNIFT